MDFTTPIDITAVQTAVREHKDLLIPLDSMSSFDILQHFTLIPGVKDAITLGRTTLGKNAKKYTGLFTGQTAAGKVVPRTLTVYPCVMEMDDEPERYRRWFLSEVAGGLDPNTHPFEIWLNNYGVACHQQELHDVLLTAAYDSDQTNTDIATAFDGLLTIVSKEKTSGNIAAVKGNLIATGALTRANVGDKLLEMWRKMPQTFRRQNSKMFISVDLGDLYDDWLDDQGTLITGSGAETAGQQFLRGTNKKVELVRLSGMPDGSQFVMLTVKDNVVWATDKVSDMQTLKPFSSGNPYHYTAAGKYVIGFQFVCLDPTMFAVNDQPITPETNEVGEGGQGGQGGEGGQGGQS